MNSLCYHLLNRRRYFFGSMSEVILIFDKTNLFRHHSHSTMSGHNNELRRSFACRLCSHNLFIQILSSRLTSSSVDIIRQQISTILFLYFVLSIYFLKVCLPVIPFLFSLTSSSFFLDSKG